MEILLVSRFYPKLGSIYQHTNSSAYRFYYKMIQHQKRECQYSNYKRYYKYLTTTNIFYLVVKIIFEFYQFPFELV